MASSINGYILEKPLSTNNAGNCKWGFAVKDGKRYFIKEFLNPVYPSMTSGLSEDIVERKKLICRMYESAQAALYQDINECADGGLQNILEFFRAGSHYYIIMEAINEIDISSMKGKNLSQSDSIRIGRLLIHNLACLHKAEIVHSDIKMANICFFELPDSKGISARLIDFDNAFRTGVPPESSEAAGDQVYLAPETFMLMCGEDIKLTAAIDVFALGLVLYQLFSKMKLPGFDTSEFSYPFEALIGRSELKLDYDILPKPFDSLITEMLVADPEKRITLQRADEILRGDGIYLSEEESGEEASDYEMRLKKLYSSGLIVGRGFEKIFGVDSDKDSVRKTGGDYLYQEREKPCEEDYFSAMDDL